MSTWCCMLNFCNMNHNLASSRKTNLRMMPLPFPCKYIYKGAIGWMLNMQLENTQRVAFANGPEHLFSLRVCDNKKESFHFIMIKIIRSPQKSIVRWDVDKQPIKLRHNPSIYIFKKSSSLWQTTQWILKEIISPSQRY